MELHTAQSLRRTHGLDIQPYRWRSFRSQFSAVVGYFRELSRRDADRQRLMAMSNRELADIGLTRSDVVAAFSSRKWPFRRSDGGRTDA